MWIHSSAQENLFTNFSDSDPRFNIMPSAFTLDNKSAKSYAIYKDNPLVSKITLVEVNPNVFKDSALFINYGSQRLLVNRYRLKKRERNNFSWFGKMGDGMGIFFTVMNGDVLSKFYLGNIPCTLLPLKGKVHMLIQYNPDKLIGRCLTDGSSEKFNQNGKAPKSDNGISGSFATPLPNDNSCNVRILIAVTQTAENELALNLDEVAQMLEDETNLAYEQSQINFKMEIARIMRTTYIESNTLQPNEQSTDVVNFRNGVPPLDATHAMREVYQSDIQVLIRKGDFLIGGGQLFGEAYEVPTGTNNPNPANAYCWVTTDFIIGGRFTFAHEISHLFGARHDDDNRTPVYARGFILNNNFGSIRTIMSTSNVVPCGTPGNGCRVQFFSNPNVIFNGNVMGAADRNNARRINETSDIVKNNRSTPENLIVQNETFDNGILANHLANSTITTNGSVNVLAGSRVTMRTSDDIILNNGFEAIAGSDFLATLNNSPCSVPPPVARMDHQDEVISNMEERDVKNLLKGGYIKVFPNPSDSYLYFEFGLQQSASISLTIDDLLGRKIYGVINKTSYEKGIHRIKYNTINIPQGIYIYSFKINNELKTGKVLILH